DHGRHGHINGGLPGGGSGAGGDAGGHRDFGALMRGEGGHTPITVQRSGNSLDVSGDGFLQIGVPRGSRATSTAPSNAIVTMDGAALHQAARAVVNVPAAADARSA